MLGAIIGDIVGSRFEWNNNRSMQAVGRNYPDCGYGGSFYKWMFSENPQPYNSFGRTSGDNSV